MTGAGNGYRVGVALGGGAARGWSHIGVIETLLDAGIVPQVVAGTSMGALVGGAYACQQLDKLRDWSLTVNRLTIARLLDIDLSTGGLIEGQRIQELLGELGLDRAISDLGLRYAAVATHLLDGREIWLEQGSLTDAIRASIAIPGIISPHAIDGRWLIDGGLVNKVPVSTCRALGADFIIAVSVDEGLVEKHTAELRPQPVQTGSSRLAEYLPLIPENYRPQAAHLLMQMLAPQPAAPRYLSVLATSINIMQDKIMRSRLAGEPPHAMILPRVAHLGLMDFDQAADAIECGRVAAQEQIPFIKRQLGATEPG